PIDRRFRLVDRARLPQAHHRIALCPRDPLHPLHSVQPPQPDLPDQPFVFGTHPLRAPHTAHAFASKATKSPIITSLVPVNGGEEGPREVTLARPTKLDL
ncbi:MAG: hypothetical protein GYB64_15880, partial [Chloroflexi bacterium]|nr:hypothetical protein [Chloroflexota bacterium]